MNNPVASHRVDSQVKVIVTDKTKRVMGVTTLVV
jgi:hypothetical protein